MKQNTISDTNNVDTCSRDSLVQGTFDTATELSEWSRAQGGVEGKVLSAASQDRAFGKPVEQSVGENDRAMFLQGAGSSPPSHSLIPGYSAYHALRLSSMASWLSKVSLISQFPISCGGFAGSWQCSCSFRRLLLPTDQGSFLLCRTQRWELLGRQHPGFIIPC